MLVIRLFRVGKKNQPSFKIVVTDKRRPPRGGRFVEEVGFYNPLTKQTNLKAERIKYRISVGAKPLATVFNMLIKNGVIEDKKIPVHKKSKKKGSEAPISTAVPVTTAPIPEKPAEEPKAETPQTAEEPKPADLSADSSSEGLPKEEASAKAEEPKVEVPPVEEAKTETPQVETPATPEEPKVVEEPAEIKEIPTASETPVIEAPKEENPQK